jgi:hypothetical protein
MQIVAQPVATVAQPVAAMAAPVAYGIVPIVGIAAMAQPVVKAAPPPPPPPPPPPQPKVRTVPNHKPWGFLTQPECTHVC